jgi:hypothetical protein
MKKYLLILLCAGLASCGTEPSAEKKTPAADTSVAAPAGCDAMPIFREGTVIENITRDGNGNELAKSTNVITRVSEENGMKISDMKVSVGADSPFHTQYKCDGNVFYVDMGSLMGSLRGMTNIKKEEVFIDFPLDMKVGDTLSNPQMTITFNADKIAVMLQNKLSKRYVAAKEKVTTAAGTWDCFKIMTTMNIHSEMKGGAAAKPMEMNKQMEMIIYFSVNAGMIRMELFEDNKLSSRADVISIRN